MGRGGVQLCEIKEEKLKPDENQEDSATKLYVYVSVADRDPCTSSLI